MIDFTPLLEALVVLLASVVTMVIVPALRERYSNEQLEKARSWVQIGVYAMEKVYGAGNGAQKLAGVEALLAEHKIKLDTSALKAMIDAEIEKMELGIK